MQIRPLRIPPSRTPIGLLREAITTEVKRHPALLQRNLVELFPEIMQIDADWDAVRSNYARLRSAIAVLRKQADNIDKFYLLVNTIVRLREQLDVYVETVSLSLDSYVNVTVACLHLKQEIEILERKLKKEIREKTKEAATKENVIVVD